jgi:hypothetical protein
MTTQSTNHRWQFARSGGFDQVKLETAADLANLEQLDQKLWAALACPVRGLEFDERTLTLIDTDNDGRIRAPEIVAAVQWCEDHLKDLAALKAGTDKVPLAQINDQTANGRAILASARQLLKDLGKPGATEISLADVTDTAKAFAQTNFNGDGIVPADAAGDDAATRKVIEEMIAAVGAVADRSGKPGVDQAKVDAFFAQLTTFDEWARKGEDPALAPLGGATAAAADAWCAVKAKVDDYFARCRVAEFDARAIAAVNRNEEEYLALAAGEMSITNQEVAGFPLSRIEPGRPLDLVSGLNPAWAGAVAALRAAAVAPILGKGKATLTADEWAQVGAKLAGFVAWRGAKPATGVEPLGVARVREILASGAKAAVEKRIAEDKALESEFQQIGQVERLVRYHRDLYRLLHNFVNFGDFYSRQRPAVFQAGTLYLDQRACSLCVRVADGGRHAALAGMSKAYLAYCDCTRPGGEKIQIAAAFTGGDSDYLMVGRNGVFYDRQGRDWDATITKVIENPISIRQAFWAPYKKLVRLIEEQVAKRAAAAEAESDAKIAAAAATTANADKAAAAAKPEPKKIDIGTVAAISVALSGIGLLVTSVVGYLAGLFDLPFWQLVLAFAGLMLVVSGPSMLIAWLKLRQRNMGPILDANGWAVNGRVKMNVPFGGSLTSVAQLPPGAIPAADPFGEKPSPWPKVVKWVVIVWFFVSLLDWYALIWQGLHAAGVKSFDIPGFLTSPADVKVRENKAAAPAATDAPADAPK